MAMARAWGVWAWAVVVLVVLAACGTGAAELHGPGLAVTVHEATGAYRVVYNAAESADVLAMESGPTCVSVDHALRCSSDGQLVLHGAVPSKGNDTVGAYEQVELQWGTRARVLLAAAVRVYVRVPAVAFVQRFPAALRHTSVGALLTRSPSVVFPSWQAPANVSVVTYRQDPESLQLGAVHGDLGAFAAAANIAGGQVAALFTPHGTTAVLSPLASFKSALQVANASIGCAVCCGLHAAIDGVPAGFEFTTLLHFGVGVRRTHLAWGRVLRRVHNKTMPTAAQHSVLARLSYWTDNGAFPYYNPQAANYEVMLERARQIHFERQLPFSAVQIDSWWYVKGKQQGLIEWVPAQGVFSSSSMSALATKLGTKLVAHSRWFSPHTTYAAKFPFVIDAGAAAPKDAYAFFDWLFAGAAPWLAVYEQDWTGKQFAEMTSWHSNVHDADAFFAGMARAAAKHRIGVAYGTVMAADVLCTLDCPTCVFVFAGANPVPGAATDTSWHIGLTSLFMHSVGVHPFKDTFWSTPSQAPTIYRNTTHPGQPATFPNTHMHALLASLSGGPVGPGDKAGAEDTALLHRTCMRSGVLLKPDRPLTMLDACVLPHSPLVGAQVFSTTAHVSGVDEAWVYLFIANVWREGVTLSPADLDVDAPDVDAVAFDPLHEPFELLPFTPDSPLVLRAHTRHAITVDYDFMLLAPVLPNGWVLLGEAGEAAGKFVAVSRTRITSVAQWGVGHGAGLSVSVVGSEGERVTLWMRSAVSSVPFSTTCDVPPALAVQFWCGTRAGTSSCECNTVPAE